MCVCVCMCMYVCVCVCMRVYVCTRMYRYIANCPDRYTVSPWSYSPQGVNLHQPSMPCYNNYIELDT